MNVQAGRKLLDKMKSGCLSSSFSGPEPYPSPKKIWSQVWVSIQIGKKYQVHRNHNVKWWRSLSANNEDFLGQRRRVSTKKGVLVVQSLFVEWINKRVHMKELWFWFCNSVQGFWSNKVVHFYVRNLHAYGSLYGSLQSVIFAPSFLLRVVSMCTDSCIRLVSTEAKGTPFTAVPHVELLGNWLASLRQPDPHKYL